LSRLLWWQRGRYVAACGFTLNGYLPPPGLKDDLPGWYVISCLVWYPASFHFVLAVANCTMVGTVGRDVAGKSYFHKAVGRGADMLGSRTV